MSSEMFYPSGDDVDRMIELAIQCGIDNRGTSWPLELCRVRAKLRALLARTEAGEDGAVAWVSKDDPMFGDSWIATTPMLFSIKEPELAEKLVPLYTHPQDASGDAERALEWLGGEMRTSTVYMNGSRAFSPSSFAMRRHDLRGRTFLEAVLNAMQAKEAK